MHLASTTNAKTGFSVLIAHDGDTELGMIFRPARGEPWHVAITGNAGAFARFVMFGEALLFLRRHAPVAATYAEAA